jgi:hypothetical protein
LAVPNGSKKVVSLADNRPGTGEISGGVSGKEQADFCLFCRQKSPDLLEFLKENQGA